MFVVVYATLVIAGRRTYEQVPDGLKNAVKTELNSMGLDENGQPVD
ncbi:CD1375 family protein [Aureibacillus halotolerans]|uniref:Uncharacterized protein n=1 Tax=Aureibacillus halotolerans TaxID=1508390 RepID=A0A4V3D4E6_9BACI|nr:CD1375 family protein [Aureibacillus halotolerans]TDQ35298.1 hypothetical protein EV213_12285 [Aureibacillus halotolerans]